MASSVLPLRVLMYDAYGLGGVARTVVTLANHLAQHRPVEVISLRRRRDEPRFPLAPEVRLTVLDDCRRRRSPVRRHLASRPTRLVPEPAERTMSQLTDRVLQRSIRALDGGILLSTRPSLHLAATRFAGPGVLTVGQDHLNFPARYANPRQARVLDTVVPRLDAYVVLTEADARDYRASLPGLRTDVRVIRNASPWPVHAVDHALRRKVVVAAGRLSAEKGFDRLLRAYVPIARSHPDWQLHIYGVGRGREALASQIRDARLDGQVQLMGFSHDLRAVLAEASVYALSSRREGFPMVLVEAMSTGLPAVAFDCPRGPAEIIDDGVNGRLVPDGDIGGLSAALRSLVTQPDVRRGLGEQALEDARCYEVERIGRQWEQLFDDLARQRDR